MTEPLSAIAALELPPPARLGDPVAAIDTPALVLALDAFERNVARMQDAATRAGVALRPHAKAHKSPDIARAQLTAGAVGICCQKVSEALPFVRAGIRDIHISNEIAGPAKAALLAQLARLARVSVCVDDAAQVDLLALAARAAGSRIDVFVEIDTGQHRCGVGNADAALRLAERIGSHDALRLSGLQAYHGGIQHERGWQARRMAAQRAAEYVGKVIAALEGAGIRCETVTGGGTGSVEFDLDSGVYTEVQPGSYVFMDADYARNETQASLRFEHSLFLATTVMSVAAGDRAIVDAGLKSLAVDSGLPWIWRDGAPDAGVAYTAANDEHGILAPAQGASPEALPALGEPLLLVPGHCDPTLNLHDWIVGVRDGRVASLWPVAARGLSR